MVCSGPAVISCCALGFLLCNTCCAHGSLHCVLSCNVCCAAMCAVRQGRNLVLAGVPVEPSAGVPVHA